MKKIQVATVVALSLIILLGIGMATEPATLIPPNSQPMLGQEGLVRGHFTETSSGCLEALVKGHFTEPNGPLLPSYGPFIITPKGGAT